MIAFSAWRNKNTRWLMRLLQARCGINCYVQIDKFHEAFHVMCIVSYTELQDKQRKHGLWEMKWERQPHDILVSDLFMSHWKMLRDHDEGCGIMNQNGIEQKQFLPNEVMKISHCGPVLHLVMCVNSADCVGDSASMGNAWSFMSFCLCLGLWKCRGCLKSVDGSIWMLQFPRQLWKSFLACGGLDQDLSIKNTITIRPALFLLICAGFPMVETEPCAILIQSLLIQIILFWSKKLYVQRATVDSVAITAKVLLQKVFPFLFQLIIRKLQQRDTFYQ